MKLLNKEKLDAIARVDIQEKRTENSKRRLEEAEKGRDTKASANLRQSTLLLRQSALLRRYETSSLPPKLTPRLPPMSLLPSKQPAGPQGRGRLRPTVGHRRLALLVNAH